MPARFLAPVVIVAVYWVPGKRLLAGVKDAVVPEYETIPVTGVDVIVCFRVKFVAGEIRVDDIIGTLKGYSTILFRSIPVALFSRFCRNHSGAVPLLIERDAFLDILLANMFLR